MDQLLRLFNIMERLRDPENGCPWDLKQTFSSIAPYTVEEVFEVIDAIDRQDFPQLQDELGDLLLQIVYYAQIAKEQDLFDFNDVAKSICDKLVRRHPHVFEKDGAELSAVSWESIKKIERAEKYMMTADSIMNDIPMALPQLLRAKKIQKRASTVGFDWSNTEDVLLKVEEELNELKTEISDGSKEQKLEEELGDVLFSIVNLSRHLKINSEDALRKSNNKFICRFKYIENKLKKESKQFDDCTINELENYWKDAKKALL